MVGRLSVGGATAPIPLVAQPPTSPEAKRTASRLNRRIHLLNGEGGCEVSTYMRSRKNENMGRDVEGERAAIAVYASTERTLAEDLKSLIAAVSGDSSEHKPTRVVGRVDVDPLEAHDGGTKTLEPYDPSLAPTPRAILVPPKVRDLDRIAVAPDQVAIVRIVPARDRLAVRAVALAGLLVAVGFLLFLLAL
jgi:hypothetical protein